MFQMYRPDHFREEKIEVLHAMMRQVGAATIVSTSEDGLVATHVPIALDDDPAPFGTIRCHFVRSNPHVELMGEPREHLIVFQGPQGYVSPSWYATKAETEKVVPTWNYIAVHAYGTAKRFEGSEQLRPHLATLTAQFEEGLPEPWSIDDAPADYVDAMCKGIVGVEISLSRIEGKWKLSQNRPQKDRSGVVDGLKGRGDEASRGLADLVEDAT